MREHCPICTASGAPAIMSRKATPVMLNRLYKTAEDARTAPTGPLEIARCGQCGFAWNKAFDPSLLQYDDAYDNDQMHSPAFLAHVNARALEVVAAAGDDPIDYLEIGCGQGQFLRLVAERAKGRLRSATGFDPAWRGEDGEGPEGARVHKVYFNSASASKLERAPDVVASRHTIEHIPDPLAFLREVRATLGPSSRATIFIETPCVDWILRNGAVQDFFYEHCSIFTASSLALALAQAGFGDIRVDHVFGGQYLWARASAMAGDGETPRVNAVPMTADADFGAALARWRSAIRAARHDGPVALWGAGAKGVTFSLLMADAGGATEQAIDHVIDINPGKQFMHLPGTGLQVLSPEAAAARRPATIFVMNPNYLDEVKAIAAAHGLGARILPIT